MNKLIRTDGLIDFGIYETPIHSINYKDYRLESPLGKRIPDFMKKLRFKQFNFIGILGPDLMAGLAVVDLKYLSNGFFYIYDQKENRVVETKKIAPSFSCRINKDPSNMESTFSLGDLKIHINGGRVTAKGRDIALEVELDLHRSKPLRICTRAGYRGWVYTEKTTPVPVSGHIRCQGKSWDISSPDYMGLVDWSAGFMRRNTYWNWAAAATVLPDGRSMGLNLASGVNETGFTENAFWLDHHMVKVDTVNFMFHNDDTMKPWTIRSYDKKIDLEFQPLNKREEKTSVQVIASRFTQLMGFFSGTLVSDTGETIRISDVPGYCEDHYAKW